MDSQIIIRKQRLPFTQVPNDLLCNPKISGLAKALWCVLYSKPDEWTFYWNEIRTNFKEGRDALRKASKELQDLGYIQKYQKKVNKGKGMTFGGMQIDLFYDPKIPFDPDIKGSSSITEISSSRLSTSKKTYTYKEISNKDLIHSSSSEEKKKKLTSEEIKDKIKDHFKDKGLKSNVEEFLLYHDKNIHKTFNKLSYWADKWEKKFIEDVEPKRNPSESSSPARHVSEDKLEAYDRMRIIMEYCKKNCLNPDSLSKEEKEEIINGK